MSRRSPDALRTPLAGLGCGRLLDVIQERAGLSDEEAERQVYDELRALRES
jgi:hypothetical protein